MFAGSNDAWKSRVGRFFHGFEEAQIALPTPAIRRSTRVSKPRRNPIALAREWDSLLADGTYSSRAELARGLGISRARVTQVLNLLNLAPPVLEAVSSVDDPRRGITEHALRRLLKLAPKEQEQVMVSRLLDGNRR